MAQAEAQNIACCQNDEHQQCIARFVDFATAGGKQYSAVLVEVADTDGQEAKPRRISRHHVRQLDGTTAMTMTNLQKSEMLLQLPFSSALQFEEFAMPC